MNRYRYNIRYWTGNYIGYFDLKGNKHIIGPHDLLDKFQQRIAQYKLLYNCEYNEIKQFENEIGEMSIHVDMWRRKPE